MNTWLARCLLGGLLLSVPALAQDDDDPYAYPDDEPEQNEDESYDRRRKEVDQVDDFREVSEQEGEEGAFDSMARLDDPNLGVAVELIAGALLLDSAQGQLADTRLGLGVRATWEYGRILNIEPLREALWADFRWTYGSLSNGTDFITGDTRLHYFTIAPAYELKLGQSDFGVFGQVGGGLTYVASSLTVGEAVTNVSGAQPVLQYGIGFRGRPKITSSGNLRLAFRLEALGFRRGYMNDFFLGGSVGTAF